MGLQAPFHYFTVHLTFHSIPGTESKREKIEEALWPDCAYRKSRLGQEAAGAYLLQIRCSGYLLRQQWRSTRSPRCELRTKVSCRRVGKRELEHLSPGVGIAARTA